MSTGKQKKYIRHPDKYIRNPDKPFVSAFPPGFKNEDFSGSFISVIFTEIPPGSSFGGKNQFFFNHDLQKWKTLAYYKTQSSGRSSVVEHHVANVMVEGSNPFTRSISFSLFSPNHQNGTFVPFHRKNIHGTVLLKNRMGICRNFKTIFQFQHCTAPTCCRNLWNDISFRTDRLFQCLTRRKLNRPSKTGLPRVNL